MVFLGEHGTGLRFVCTRSSKTNFLFKCLERVDIESTVIGRFVDSFYAEVPIFAIGIGDGVYYHFCHKFYQSGKSLV